MKFRLLTLNNFILGFCFPQASFNISSGVGPYELILEDAEGSQTVLTETHTDSLADGYYTIIITDYMGTTIEEEFEINCSSPEAEYTDTLITQIDTCFNELVASGEVEEVTAGEAGTVLVEWHLTGISGSVYVIVNEYEINEVGEYLAILEINCDDGSKSQIRFTDEVTVNEDIILNIERANNLIISAYPNPFTECIQLNLHNSTKKNIQIININGQIVYNKQTNNNTILINTQRFTSGIYLIKVMSGDNVLTLKMIK